MEITDEELTTLNRVILTRYGIDFTAYEPNSFKRRITRAISVFNLESVHALGEHLLANKNFICSFVDELTVGLTAMFRDPVLWQTLKKGIVHNFRQQSSLQIWHAGCSTGEEVFTMGIVLNEANLPGAACTLATDLNQKSIRQAKEGKYDITVMDEYTRNYKLYNPIKRFTSYYTLQDDKAIFDSSLIRQVQFRHHNLVMERMDQKFDIIFCRNVMIYFDTATKLQLLKNFHYCLNEGGFLIIGFYDTLLPLIDNSMFEIYNLDAKIFRKV